MSIRVDFEDEEGQFEPADDEPPRRNGRDDHRRRGPRGPSDAAYNAAQRNGGEPEDFDQEPAYKAWTDTALTQAGFGKVKEYPYRAPNGRVLFFKDRYEHPFVPGEKKFILRRPAPDEVSSVGYFAHAGLVMVPYRWPELIAAVAANPDVEVNWCEGEKDADTLAAMGLVATTAATKKITITIIRALEALNVQTLNIWEDNDEVGRHNALKIAQLSSGIVRREKIIRIPGLARGKDVTDWVNTDPANNTKEALLEIVAKMPEWEPEGTIKARPHNFPDVTTLPLYDWLYGKHLLRGTTSVTAATGGTGKSSQAIVEALAMTSGKPLLRLAVPRPLRVLLINLEDNRQTMDKRVAAAMKHYQLTPEQIGDRLFIIAKGEMKLKIAKYGKFKIVEVNEALIKSLSEFITANKIDVVSIDPFIKTHGVSENDNVDIETVVECFDDIAEETQCAISLWHHTVKMRGEGATVDSARGAGSLIDTVRAARIAQTMTKDEAKNLKLQEPGFFFRSFSGKRNFAPPSDECDWYRLVSVDIGNAFPFGDEIGVVTRWDHPGATITEITLPPVEMEMVKTAVRGGNWRAHPLSSAWVGKPIARALGRDPEEDGAAIKALIKSLLKSGILKEVQGQDGHYHDVMFVVVTE